MKKIYAITIKILLVILIMQFIFIPICNASAVGNIISDGQIFIDKGRVEQDKAETINIEDTKTAINNMYNILFGIGVVVTILAGGILGIKLMFRKCRGTSKMEGNVSTICFWMYNNIWGIWNMEIGSNYSFGDYVVI